VDHILVTLGHPRCIGFLRYRRKTKKQTDKQTHKRPIHATSVGVGNEIMTCRTYACRPGSLDHSRCCRRRTFVRRTYHGCCCTPNTNHRTLPHIQARTAIVILQGDINIKPIPTVPAKIGFHLQLHLPACNAASRHNIGLAQL